ncbi:sodium/glutamate symporter [Selenihalanaerobacter shriftii]|uniref:Glutamate:Na+ symporter, ESS family n=1 Tax=Selenihalanaerobacter shriftii TaxID=142842 RepID=A0A1T4MQM9_9FIRM|nr:sodium/glutamate symporter [Selenihalanaerobacter shriftii]SJZ69085.1 glutamate:Na+ symporter, ESS family [Selenihalanaerobacter shriftii]
MQFGPYDLLMDFGLMSGLLFIAQVLRSRIKLIQNLYLPSSLIAGFLGLFLGPQFLGWLPFSDQMASYAYMLVVVLFATLFIGKKQQTSVKKVIDKVGDTFTLNLAAEIGGFGTSLLIGGFILKKFFPDVPEMFAILQPAGFVGGHGYAAAIGGTLKTVAGWKEALTIGQTFATVGILSGVFGGLVLINIATRIKATRFIKTMAELPDSMRTGLVPEDKRNTMGQETVNPMSIDPLSWHLLLVLIATAGGYYSYYGFKAILPEITLPMMCLSMLSGVLLHFILKAVGLGDYVDRKVITRIGSTATDYLVGFGVASIKVAIVVKYAAPIIIMTAIGVGYGIFFLFFVGRKLFQNFWFERSIFVYGWSTGVVAMGVTLLRIVDPEFESGTLEDYGMAYMVIAFIELAIVSIVPLYVAKGNVMLSGAILLAIWAILLLITAWKYGVRDEGVADFRPGEKEVIEG